MIQIYHNIRFFTTAWEKAQPGLSRRSFLCALILGVVTLSCTQTTPRADISCENPRFDKVIQRYLRFTVPTIGVEELSQNNDQYLLFDAREYKEYEVSHIKGAEYVGYDDFPAIDLKGLDRDQPIVVYCSIGYRSEKVGEKLIKMGFTNVKNLYGSLFEWVNSGNEVYDSSSKRTDKIHGYSRQWSKWIDNPESIKIH